MKSRLMKSMVAVGSGSMLLLFAVALLTSASGCDEECDADGLRARLAAARPGDVVEVGACTLEGPFQVPSGITLRGAGRDRTVLTGQSDVLVTIASGSDSPTRIEDLSLLSSGCAALVARGATSLTLARVAARAERGIGLGVEDITDLAFQDVLVEGPLSDGSLPAEVPLPPYDCRSEDPATHGIVLLDVSAARLEGVTVRGFAAFGVLTVRSDFVWVGGGADQQLGTGLSVFGGSVELDGIELCRARQGLAPIESFNGFFAAGATVTSSGLRVCEGETFGLMHDRVTARHVDLEVRDNGFAGVWAQDSPSLVLEGAATEISGNGFAGVAAVRVESVSLTGGALRDTRLRTSTIRDVGALRAADGLHLVDNGAVAVQNVTLVDNERIGLLLDVAGGTTLSSTFEDVVVEGAGEQLGAVAQGGVVEEGWDARITRVGATLSNDARVSDALDIVGAVGPSCFPNADQLRMFGLDALMR